MLAMIFVVFLTYFLVPYVAPINIKTAFGLFLQLLLAGVAVSFGLEWINYERTHDFTGQLIAIPESKGLAGAPYIVACNVGLGILAGMIYRLLKRKKYPPYLAYIPLYALPIAVWTFLKVFFLS